MQQHGRHRPSPLRGKLRWLIRLRIHCVIARPWRKYRAPRTPRITRNAFSIDRVSRLSLSSNLPRIVSARHTDQCRMTHVKISRLPRVFSAKYFRSSLSSYSDRESVMLPWRFLINPDKYIRIIRFIVSYAYWPYNYVTLSNRSFEMTRIACLMAKSIVKAGYEDCVELFKCTRDKNATQRRTQRYLTSSRVGTRYMEQSRHSSKNSY